MANDKKSIEQLISGRRICEYLGVSEAHFKMLRENGLPVFKVMDKTLWRAFSEDLDEWMKAHREVYFKTRKQKLKTRRKL